MNYQKSFWGEGIGTFLMVLFGCGTVAVSVLFNQYQSIFQIGALWGLGLIIAIYATRDLCCAHFNPAVSIAMVVTGRMDRRKLPVYLCAQFFGAFAAALVLYGLFSGAIASYEALHGILRGSPESMQVAKMFGEYYQLPGAAIAISLPEAMAAEGIGTGLLVFMIFALTDGCNTGRPSNGAAPLFIGLTLSSIICLVAPLTQAGLNPARDFAPRIAAWLFGWGAGSGVRKAPTQNGPPSAAPGSGLRTSTTRCARYSPRPDRNIWWNLAKGACRPCTPPGITFQAINR